MAGQPIYPSPQLNPPKEQPTNFDQGLWKPLVSLNMVLWYELGLAPSQDASGK